MGLLSRVSMSNVGILEPSKLLTARWSCIELIAVSVMHQPINSSEYWHRYIITRSHNMSFKLLYPRLNIVSLAVSCSKIHSTNTFIVVCRNKTKSVECVHK